MKNLIVFLSLILAATYSSAQDQIITYHIGYDSINCKIEDIGDDFVRFRDHTSRLDSIATYRISSCIFNQGPDVIVIPGLVFDTVEGLIENIGNKSVYFSTGANVHNKIKKSDIFTCRFADSPWHEKIKQFSDFDKNLAVAIVTYQLNELRADNGRVYDAVVDTIDDEQVGLTIKYLGIDVRSHIARDQGREYFIHQFEMFNGQSFRNDYILTTEGILKKIKIATVIGDHVSLKLPKAQVKKTIEERKDQIPAVFFRDYNTEPGIENRLLKNKKDFKKVEFHLSFGYGIRHKWEVHDSDPEIEHVIKGLRQGMLISLGVNFYFIKHFGWGFYGKYFHTSVNTNFFNEDQKFMTTDWFGAISLNYRTNLFRSFDYNLMVNPGLFRFSEKFRDKEGEIIFYGDSFGLNITNRIGKTLTNGVGAYFEVSYFTSRLYSMLYENHIFWTQDLPDVSRIEIAVGIRYYLK